MSKMEQASTQLTSLREYNCYIKEQFKHQLGFIKKFIEKAVSSAQLQEQVIKDKHQAISLVYSDIDFLKAENETIKKELTQSVSRVFIDC